MRPPAPEPPGYSRRKPEETDLHRIVSAHLPAFLEHMEAAGGMPGFVKKTFAEYLTCGDLRCGFGRLHCPTCGDDLLVAFSCKRRGLCPSCGGRKMADTAAHLVDRVLPANVPVRQWVLTFPFALRRMLAYDARLNSAVLARFIAAVTRHYTKRARRAGLVDPQTGSVTALQRFGSALNVNPHVHALFLDGTFDRPAPDRPLRFRAHPKLTDAEVAAVLADFQRSLRRLLESRGLLGDEAAEACSEEAEAGPLEQLELASVSGQPAFGPPPGKVQPSASRASGRARHAPKVQPLCVEDDGFTLHARTRVARDKRGELEVLCRYILRPPIAVDRIRMRGDGLVELSLPRRWSDGTTALTFEPMAFMARLVPIIPRPRVHEVRYHGLLSPHAKDRKEVTASAPNAGGLRHDHDPKRPSNCPRERRLEWAELLKRTWAIDVLRCAKCGGKRTLLAFVRDPKAIRAILGHLGLPTSEPAAPRGPPQGELDLP